MTTTTFNPIDEAIEENQRLAEEQALAVGERLEREEEEATLQLYEKGRQQQEEEQAVLPEKFKGKSAAEIARAYLELEKKLGQKGAEVPETEGKQEQEEASSPSEDVSPQEEETEAFLALKEASEAYYANDGKIDQAVLEKLHQLPSDQLVEAYLKLQANVPVAKPISDEQALEIVKEVGGQELYNQALAWAADNLTDAEKASYDQVVQSGNLAATRFAVEALTRRYKDAEGFDGQPLNGGKSLRQNSRVKPYRSEAELRRDLSDRRYQEDPAFRIDVEERLAASGELLA